MKEHTRSWPIGWIAATIAFIAAALLIIDIASHRGEARLTRSSFNILDAPDYMSLAPVGLSAMVPIFGTRLARI